ncbi:MAG: YitT family protein [Butyricicoccus sp.]|nr:YitT family protein [Butyricicoccus sp.]
MKKTLSSELKNLIIIALGSLIYAAAISNFLDPNQLAPGGISGISVILNHLTSIETGTLYLLFNVPIVALGIWKFGLRFMAKTAYAIVLVSAFTNLLAPLGALTDDLLIAGVAGGFLIAVGIGIIFKAGATTGGMDIVIKLLRGKFRHLKTGFLFLCVDVIVVTISGLVFRDLNLAFYALGTVIISGKALDFVLYGGDEAKLIFIMSDHSHAIGSRMMKELDVGVTYLSGKGGWKETEKQVLLTVVPKRLGPQVGEIVKVEDPAAFTIITSASEIYGEGYKDLFAEAL